MKSAGVETLLITGATGFVGSHVIEVSSGYKFQVRYKIFGARHDENIMIRISR